MIKQYAAVRWLALLALLALTACAHAPATFNQKSLAAYGAAEAAVATANDLAVTGTISKAVHRNVLDQARAFRTALDLAVQMHAKDPADGDRGLDYALAALRSLQAFLVNYQKEKLK